MSYRSTKRRELPYIPDDIQDVHVVIDTPDWQVGACSWRGKWYAYEWCRWNPNFMWGPFQSLKDAVADAKNHVQRVQELEARWEADDERA
jgi:hypothetical protein